MCNLSLKRSEQESRGGKTEKQVEAEEQEGFLKWNKI